MAYGNKDARTNNVYEKIRKEIPEALETNYAELGLTTLSFKSRQYPSRHIWLDTDNEELAIDLEDWDMEGEWDNAIARIRILSLGCALELMKSWVTGGDLSEFGFLGKKYEYIQRE